MRISKELDDEWRVVGLAQPGFASLTVGWTSTRCPSNLGSVPVSRLANSTTKPER